MLIVGFHASSLRRHLFTRKAMQTRGGRSPLKLIFEPLFEIYLMASAIA